MPRGRRRAAPDVNTLEQELQALKQRQSEIRAQLRRMKSGASGVRKLEQKLEKQLATAKWTVQQIKEIRADWDDLGFYQTVKAKQPTPRGRRPRAAAAA
jgi:chromosome segregation ATPase